MEDLWFRQLGFYNNPLSIKPAAFHDEIIGFEEQTSKLEKSMDVGSIWFIEGLYGSGKTSALKRIIRRFGGQKRVIYYSCATTENYINIDQLLYNRNGWFGRLFKIKPKNLILLLDEVKGITSYDQEKIISYHDTGHFKSVVLVGRSIKESPLNKELKGLIGENIINLSKVDEETSVKIIRKRIGDTKIISDKMIKEIFKRSDSNPRKLLENTEDVLKLVVEQGDKEVKDEHLKKVFS